jgi:hypothetical protein
VIEGVSEEDEVEEPVMLLVEESEAPLVVEETELCPVELERPDWEDSLDEGDEPEVDPDEEAVLVTLPEPLAVVEELLVDGTPVFGSDQQ